MIKKANFIKSAANKNDWIDDDILEVALIGKSNVGKSTFINAICNNNKLAKTSQTPGKTQLLNFYNINDGEFRFVDCPGYGYSKLSLDKQKKLKNMTLDYLIARKNLKFVFLLIDSRHNPGENDLAMYNFLKKNDIKIILILTKLDKLKKKNDIKKNYEKIIAILNHQNDSLIISSHKKINIDQIYLIIKKNLSN